MFNSNHRRSVSWNLPTQPSCPEPKQLPSASSHNRSLSQVPSMDFPFTAPQFSKTRSFSNEFSGPPSRYTARRSQSSVPEIEPLPNCVIKCAYRTHTGLEHNRPKPHNQDTFLIKSYLKGLKGQYLFAVCDGHGPNGHFVSEFIKETLPRILEDLMPVGRSSVGELSQILKLAIYYTEQALLRSQIDLNISGSTLVCLLVSGSSIACANIGDSRAVVGQYKNNWHALELTRDHKPELPDEMARIKRCGGIVTPSTDYLGRPVGPCRVWFSQDIVSGLAMSRSLGDLAVSSVGVSSEPEVFSYTLQTCDKFIILATDGVWEFISSRRAVKIVKRGWEEGRNESSCEALVKEAVNMWRSQDDGMDDITVIVLFLNVM